MKIETDYYYFDGKDNPRVKRGLALVVPNQLRVGGTEAGNTRLMDAIAQRFVVYQYNDPEKKIPYDEGYDFFFWCNDKFFTTNGREHGNDMEYFTLSTNDKRPFARQMEDYAKLRQFIADWTEEARHACFTWTVKDDDAAVSAEARRVLASITPGETVEYRGMRGKLRRIGGDWVFVKLRVKKSGYRLKLGDICDIRKIGKEAA